MNLDVTWQAKIAPTTIEGMTVSDLDVSLKAAEAIARLLTDKPNAAIGLPTGRTPLGCYKLLAEWSKSGKLDWSRAKCFALDDYLDAQESKSFAHYLEENLYKHTNLPSQSKFNPRFCDDYDALIADVGGLDLTLVGIGHNGHVAFNEPGTPLSSWTHCLLLTESTRTANSSFFGTLDQTPRRAITMGISTILASRQIILLASGMDKQKIMHSAFYGAIGTDVPASFLQNHFNVNVITDFDYSRSNT